MRKVTKSSGRNELVEFALQNPNATWEDFRNTNDYSTLKHRLFSEQSYLCSFCEVDLSKAPATKQRVEHFNSKAASTRDENLHLDWNNLLGVCIGGSDERAKFPLPKNLSCDAHKAHVESSPQKWDGVILSPLNIPSECSLFNLEKRTGKLIPNLENCGQVPINPNNHRNTLEIVQKTIDILNLNCDRLNSARLKVFHHYLKTVKKTRESGDKRYLENLVLRWSGCTPLFFQTVRDQMVQEARSILSKFP